MRLLPLVVALAAMPFTIFAQQAPVNLGKAGNFVVLSKTGITNVPPSPIVGNIGASPITGAAVHVTCAEVTGTITVVDAAGPAPCSVVDPAGLGVAILNMKTAYDDAAGRTVPDFTELYAGNLSGKTLVPGLYKWSTDILVDSTGFTLSGGPNAVWIFQVAGDVTLANSAKVTLAGGARPLNVFWQVGGPTGLTLGTGATFSGTVLSAKQVIMNTGSALNGRALAETQVTLQSTSITTPGIIVSGIPVPVAPTVTSTAPSNLSAGVPIGNLITATFSEAMNAATLTPLTFTLKAGLTTVNGLVSYAGLTATFAPAANLIPNTVYTGTITTGAKDPAGVALATDYIWTFTTGPGADVTPPTVSFTVPASGAAGVAIGNAVAVTFSEAMNPGTISTTTFTLANGVTPVAGTVTYAGLTATFTPATSLAANTLFTATVTAGARDLAGNALVSNYVWTFTTGASLDVTAPTVTSTVPANAGTNVAVGSALAATFSEPMDPATISTVTFNLKQGVTPVAGTVLYAGLTATFRPVTNLSPNTSYTATITTGAKDLAGNALAVAYTWSFTSGSTLDVTAPTVTSTVPGSGSTNVALGSSLSATFSEAMDPATVTNLSFNLKQGGVVVPGTVTYAGLTATFRPLATLAPGTSFTATVTAAATDLAGNPLSADYVWNFTTGSVSDVTAPFVTSTQPASGATLVTVTTNVTANFSKPMDPLTVNTATFTLRQGGNPIAGTVTYLGTAASFRPASNLLANTVYDAVINNSARDLAGNPLATYTWSFTTGTLTSQTPVCLSNFAVLAGSAVINSGASVVTGDIGVATGSSITGFPPGTLKGTAHAADAAATQAMADLSAGYADAAARSAGPVAISGNIGGQTFTAGLYRSASSIDISSGQLVLDGKGDANAVFIFQAATTLGTSTGRQIVLVGGASASNVFWQVGTSATLGDNTAFKGSILASQSITLNAGATVEGRLLARNGTVTLQNNIVTSPAPAISTRGIFNGASGSSNVAAGSIAAVFGTNFAPRTVSAKDYPLLTLGGTTFQAGGNAAPLFMVSCSQVNLQIPWEAAGQTSVPVIATAGGQSSIPEPAALAVFAPGIFSLNQNGSGQGAVEIAPTALLAAAQDASGNRPVKKGEYIAIFGTGLGPVTNQPATGVPSPTQPLARTLTLPTVTLGGAAAEVTFSGLVPGLTGLYQVNALVPASAPTGATVPLVITIGGVTSNTVSIAVQ